MTIIMLLKFIVTTKNLLVYHYKFITTRFAFSEHVGTFAACYNEFVSSSVENIKKLSLLINIELRW